MVGSSDVNISYRISLYSSVRKLKYLSPKLLETLVADNAWLPSIATSAYVILQLQFGKMRDMFHVY
jgi:hypothetical protein